MEFLRRLDIGEEREQEAARWWCRREDAATTSGAARWWRREDVATTSAAAANRRVVPAFGGVAMTPGRIWADGNALVVYLANNEHMVLHTLFHAPLNEAHLVAEVIVDHAADIMESIHGQRLLSCVLHNCCCELHEAIVAKITQHRDRFYRICVERSDGVVTMIRSCRSLKSCQLVRNAIVPWVGRRSKMQSLVTDSDKLRVIQACIQCFPADIAKVLVDAVVENCIEIACHLNGLLFLQNCLGHITLEEKYKIFTQVCINSVYLAKHRSGNYIVQDVLEFGHPFHLEIITSCFKTHYVDLARQKYSSRVVEKCLKVFGDLEQYSIVCELVLDLDHFRDLVTDEVANYVISTALLACTVPVRDILANTIISLQDVNRHHPHCLKIFDILSRLGYMQ
ncbi:putative pumilio homolog 7, chloroplastic [Oryza glaberrima]|uniref:putative pumilio homolog 7, chloroplastic n=1 Tax=Oryza glaberrima TaxID=4538 RepID=UPI00224BEE31|nr:putative pumilio homolog 7, chloroplastic [Oryza glaberrima]